jgi:uncharacterized protein YjiS (DUF1127 family)
MTSLAIVDKAAEQHLVLYRRMSIAIDTCHRVDECKDIADKAVALAAYYKQIKDTTTVQLFYEVRLRAWRRMGKLFSDVDTSKCETVAAKIKAIRKAHANDPTLRDISDSRLREILDLMSISDSDFDRAISHELNTGSIPDLLSHVPGRVHAYPAPTPLTANEAAKRSRSDARRKVWDEAANRNVSELLEASDEALRDVGLTLLRKDRANMKQVVFLIKEPIHAVMRKASFDHKITMQDILRRGLRMWLVENGYDFPEDDAKKKSK